MRQLLMITAR